MIGHLLAAGVVCTQPEARALCGAGRTSDQYCTVVPALAASCQARLSDSLVTFLLSISLCCLHLPVFDMARLMALRSNNCLFKIVKICRKGTE